MKAALPLVNQAYNCIILLWQHRPPGFVWLPVIRNIPPWFPFSNRLIKKKEGNAFSFNGRKSTTWNVNKGLYMSKTYKASRNLSWFDFCEAPFNSIKQKYTALLLLYCHVSGDKMITYMIHLNYFMHDSGFMICKPISTISFRVPSLALGQSYDCPRASEASLKYMGK